MDFECRFAQLFDYWQSIKGPLIAPKRENFQPGTVMDLLPRLMLIEQGYQGKFPIRLTGFDIDVRLGTGLIGQDFFDIFTPVETSSGTEFCNRDFSAILDRPMGLIGARRWYADEGPFRCFFMFLPLLDSSLRPYKILAQIEFEPRYLLSGNDKLQRFGQFLTLRAIDIGAGIDDRMVMLPSAFIGRTAA